MTFFSFCTRLLELVFLLLLTHFLQVDPSSFELSIVGMRFSLARYLGRQPLQIMGKVGSQPHTRNFLFNVEMWHESLLNASSNKRSEESYDSNSVQRTLKRSTVFSCGSTGPQIAVPQLPPAPTLPPALQPSCVASPTYPSCSILAAMSMDSTSGSPANSMLPDQGRQWEASSECSDATFFSAHDDIDVQACCEIGIEAETIADSTDTSSRTRAPMPVSRGHSPEPAGSGNSPEPTDSSHPSMMPGNRRTSADGDSYWMRRCRRVHDQVESDESFRGHPDFHIEKSSPRHIQHHASLASSPCTRHTTSSSSTCTTTACTCTCTTCACPGEGALNFTGCVHVVAYGLGGDCVDAACGIGGGVAEGAGTDHESGVRANNVAASYVERELGEAGHLSQASLPRGVHGFKRGVHGRMMQRPGMLMSLRRNKNSRGAKAQQRFRVLEPIEMSRTQDTQGQLAARMSSRCRGSLDLGVSDHWPGGRIVSALQGSQLGRCLLGGAACCAQLACCLPAPGRKRSGQSLNQRERRLYTADHGGGGLAKDPSGANVPDAVNTAVVTSMWLQQHGHGHERQSFGW